MADVLDQSEVDALLAAVDSGAISTGSSSCPAKPAKTQALMVCRGIAISANGLRCTIMAMASAQAVAILAEFLDAGLSICG